MVKLKKIFFLSFIITSIYATEQNKIEKQVMSLDESDEKSNVDASSLPMITLINKEGTRYSVPRRVAMESIYIKTCLTHPEADTIYVDIPDKYLKRLINALCFIYEQKGEFKTKRFYGLIQNQLGLVYQNQFNLNEMKELFLATISLDNDYLTNAIADYFAQLLIKSLYTVNQIIDIIQPAHWFLIEKYYYLRSSEKKIHAEKLLFVQNENLTLDLFNFYFKKVPAEFNMQYIGEKIIYDMNLSVQDLLDYDKLIFVSIIGINFDLSRYGLGSLYGLNNVDDIERVQWLDLSNNQLREFPEGIFNSLNNLKRLDLYNNQLRKLPEGIFNGLNNLRELDLNHNQLRKLPEGIFNGLNNLQELYLSNNQLRGLPEGIFNGLNNLQVLYLSANQLKELSEGIFNGLNNLKLLDLFRNKLRELPKGIFNGLNNLQSLDLDNNQLSEQAKIVIQQFKQQHPNVELL